MNTLAQHLRDRIRDNTVIVGILGLGYVGLPLAVAFAKKGIRIIGFEKDMKKVEAVNSGTNYISDIDPRELADTVRLKKLEATTDFTRIR